MTWFQHVLEALRAFASKKHHGKGCHKSNCGMVCLCGPCHARVALERVEEEVRIGRTERLMMHATFPRGRWRMLSRTSPSRKTMFVCLSCGRHSVAPQPLCPEPVTLWSGESQECVDWKPSQFEVQ